jgi:hypothetical protein
LSAAVVAVETERPDRELVIAATALAFAFSARKTR